MWGRPLLDQSPGYHLGVTSGICYMQSGDTELYDVVMIVTRECDFKQGTMYYLKQSKVVN